MLPQSHIVCVVLLMFIPIKTFSSPVVMFTYAHLTGHRTSRLSPTRLRLVSHLACLARSFNICSNLQWIPRFNSTRLPSNRRVNLLFIQSLNASGQRLGEPSL